jgi:hypothetical protein
MSKLPASWDSMSESRFLKQSDFESPALVSIASFDKANVAPDNEPAEVKWIVYFAGYEKGLVLNAINRTTLGEMFGSPEDAIGQGVVVFVDPDVSFGGKKVGGVRLRAPKGTKKVEDENLPF